MYRIAALLLALGLVGGCGKKKPPAPVDEAPTLPSVEPVNPTGPPPETPKAVDSAKQLKLLRVNKSETQLTAARALASIAESDPTIYPALVDLLADKSGIPVPRTVSGAINSVREAVIYTLVLSGPKGEKLAIEKGLPVLIVALSDSNEMTRCHAAGAIGRLGAKASRAVDKLWPLASEPSPRVRETALLALSEIGNVSPGPLCKLLTNSDEGVRVTAAENLPYFSGIPADAVEDLGKAVLDTNIRVRLAAAEALNTLGAKAAPAVPALLKTLTANLGMDRIDLDEASITYLNAVVAIGEPAVPAVAKLLDDTNPVVRFLGAYILGEIGPPSKSAADALQKLQRDRQGVVALEAARALVVSTGSTDKAKELIEFALKHMEAVTRAAGLQCIGRMRQAGKPFAAMALPLLDDPDATVRTAALDYVSTLDAETAKPAIAKVGKLLADEDPDTRTQAVNVLLSLGRAAASTADLLAKAVATDKDERVRTRALDAIASLGPDGKQALPNLVKVIADPSAPATVRVRALSVATTLSASDPDLARAVTQAMNEKSQQVRDAAVIALATLTDPPADALKKLGDLIGASGTNFGDRTRAVRTAAQLGPKAAVVKDRLQVGATSEVREFASWSKLALARIGDQPAEVDRLIQAGLASPWPVERNVALTALGEVVTPKADSLPALLTASKDRSSMTRHAAVVALTRLTESPEAVIRLGEMLKDTDPDVKMTAIQGLESLAGRAKPAIKHLREVANGKDEASRAAKKAIRTIEQAGS